MSSHLPVCVSVGFPEAQASVQKAGPDVKGPRRLAGTAIDGQPRAKCGTWHLTRRHQGGRPGYQGDVVLRMPRLEP